PETYDIEIEHVTKRFGDFTAVKDMNLQIRKGEFFSMLGPSGCGKTTTLRMVAGFEQPSEGEIYVANAPVAGVPPYRRPVNTVFQNYALFPHLNVWENVAFGLKRQKVAAPEIKSRVAEALQMVEMDKMIARRPSQLSGGQQQRVALARAMALSPDLLLLDEPLSALDAQVRILLRSEIRLLQRRLGVTTLMVTHDQEEALTMADRIVVMDRGRIVQDGTPFEIYNKPATPFVASFIGSMNFIEKAVKESAGLYRIGALSLRVENGSGPLAPGAQVTMAIRPEDIVVRKAGEDTPNTVTAHISGLEFRGPHYRVTLRLSDNGETPILRADIPTEAITRLGLREAMDIGIHLPPDRIRVYTS
ncbi:MAG TPA: polyamine ABC transporter ATP-binding protein, partial [Candidatus Acidoferrum sp.]|nr:polyamine ABC transporter ATP-binding protein [Candidatus Acidoferrum sp.]